ncbi:MAG: ABC transporter ATP-binding protein [Betaproteobacteria bacterium]|nr:ABC transporter ATP-binding protein [Betaproteobacteria bacterium]
MAEALLQVERLTKRFDGLIATDKVGLEIPEREFHAIIGPNGAGKTTLVAQLTGELEPDEGTIHFSGRDVTRVSASARVLLGIARSFQISSVFPEFTAVENVSIAIQARLGHSFRFWRNALLDPVVREPALAALEQVGLADRAEVLAGHLAYGEKRVLELSMVLAARPRLLLLDEPMAGLGNEESVRILKLLAALKGSTTILLVEHDMRTVFALADRISVLVYGRILATGRPAEIRVNQDVRNAYLGQVGAQVGAG